jgi:hypothetical protein
MATMWLRKVLGQFSLKNNPPILHDKNRARIFSECFQLSLCASEAQKINPSFSLRIQTSSIPGSNQGVFLSGSVKKGTIVALYPGLYYPPLPVCAIGSIDGEISLPVTDLKQRIEDGTSEYIIHLNNSGGYLDGNPLLAFDVSDTNTPPPNPYAVAHMVNHPSPSFHPNVISLDFLWRDLYTHCAPQLSSSFEEYSKIVPNRFGSGPWYVDSSTGEVMMINDGTIPCHLAGLAYMALEDIDDSQELFFDYRYPTNARPEWYQVPKFIPPVPID